LKEEGSVEEMEEVRVEGRNLKLKGEKTEKSGKLKNKDQIANQAAGSG
jgi:hypothetical protein